MPPPPLPSPSHGPTTLNSHVTATRSLKRLSLSFPVQPIDRRSPRPSSTIASSPDRMSNPSSPELCPSTSTGSNTFLTALAAQERRVLELREELQKAEGDLDKLKQQWATQEAAKKRNEMRHIEQLRPLPVLSPIKMSTAEAGSEGKNSREEERRKAMNVRQQKPHRKVFEGGKHTRALSLLSPSTLGQAKSHARFDGNRSGRKDLTIRKASGRSATMTETTSKPIALAGTTTELNSKGTKDDLVNTGKQLVGDLKEGLWTFIEDIRQATVGDEAINGARPRNKRNSLGRSPARSISQSRIHITPTRTILPSRRKTGLSELRIPQLKSSDTLLDTEGTSVVNTNTSSKLDPSGAHHLDGTSEQPLTDISFDDEGWDNWDSPNVKHSSPTLSLVTQDSSQLTSPSLCASSPRSSTSSSDDYARRSKDRSSLINVDQLPWPALTKLSPRNLTRTASTLMKEWEASLISPDEDENNGPTVSSGQMGMKLD
ncbi:hypothetical protein MMC34_005187 [Xylographa carneopallida]|nr:hypothetical protein [Xylographa carneopallida]